MDYVILNVSSVFNAVLRPLISSDSVTYVWVCVAFIFIRHSCIDHVMLGLMTLAKFNPFHGSLPKQMINFFRSCFSFEQFTFCSELHRCVAVYVF